MLTVAYLANQFPSPVEPYVVEEIEELRRRGVRVIAGSVRKPRAELSRNQACLPEIVLQGTSIVVLLQAVWLCLRRWDKISPLILRVVLHGSEGPVTRLKALVHTWMGACYAVLLEGHHVQHIHVHHGYFGSWIAMVAAKLLGVEFSITLHGSDLLLHPTYLDAKLQNCGFCRTVSEYNRAHILQRYPRVEPKQIVVARLGVEIPDLSFPIPNQRATENPFTMPAVGRLHPVKDHAFLVRACAQLRDRDVSLECLIAGEGPERRNLESLIRQHGLEGRVTLLGHVPREHVASLYDRADVVVLTSRSEGIPLVLMEAMARGKIVLAPDITGIPELVIAGKTGFLYEAGSLEGFTDRLHFLQSMMHVPGDSDLHPHITSARRHLDWVRHAARVHVRQNFNRNKNLEAFVDLFLERVAAQIESIPDENLVLQQI